MAGGHLELVPLGEKPFRETFDAPVSVATPRPVEHGKNCRHRDGVDLLSFRNKRRVVLVLELTHRVLICERLRERDSAEFKPGSRWDPGEEVDRLPYAAHECFNLSGLQLLPCALLV